MVSSSGMYVNRLCMCVNAISEMSYFSSEMDSNSDGLVPTKTQNVLNVFEKKCSLELAETTRI